MAVSFQKPPLNEVALGCTFLARPDLQIPHIGVFWEQLRDAYPRCQQAPAIFDEPPGGLFTDLPLPRTWFLSTSGDRLVQLQQDRLICNWRDTGNGQPYIRFPAIKVEFERVLQLFSSHVESLTNLPISPAAYNLTYVNFIRQGDGWNSKGVLADAIQDVFPDVAWNSKPRFLPKPETIEWKATFALPRDLGTLTAQIQPARTIRDNSLVLRFELIATSHSLGGKDVNFEEWCGVAHDWIVDAFKDLTAEAMHRNVWNLEEREM